MTASKDYQLDNWKDPELMFGEEYQPFDLFRDLNGYTASDLDLAEDSFDNNVAKEGMNLSLEDPCMIDDKDQIKDLKIANYLTTVVSDEDQSQECLNEASPVAEDFYQTLHDNSNLVQVRHIDQDGPMILVTRKRFDRIMKQRKKRLAFLDLFPEYRLPYKNRDKKIKYKTRSMMAKNRKRNDLGKFSSFRRNGELISFEITSDDVLENTNWRRKGKP